jgi:hypothetical protein
MPHPKLIQRMDELEESQDKIRAQLFCDGDRLAVLDLQSFMLQRRNRTLPKPFHGCAHKKYEIAKEYAEHESVYTHELVKLLINEMCKKDHGYDNVFLLDEGPFVRMTHVAGKYVGGVVVSVSVVGYWITEAK